MIRMGLDEFTINVVMVNLLGIFVRWQIFMAEFFDRVSKLFCRDETVIIVIKNRESQHGLMFIMERYGFQNFLLF